MPRASPNGRVREIQITGALGKEPQYEKGLNLAVASELPINACEYNTVSSL